MSGGRLLALVLFLAPAASAVAASAASPAPAPAPAAVPAPVPAAGTAPAVRGGGGAASRPSATYTNPLPVQIADPFVFRDGDLYYLYGTAARDGLLVWTSTDLVNWQPRGHAFRRTEGTWSRRDFWAPEIFKHRGKYYLHFTANASDQRGRAAAVRRLVLAEGDSPLGPFREVRAPWFQTEFDTIDGHVFKDRDGQLYLYSVYLPRPPKIKTFEVHVRKLDDDLVPSAESTRCIARSEAWEGVDVNEGPFVVRHGDDYLLTYSGQPYWSPDYAVGIATAKSPLGPWTKSKAGPILKRADGVSGPGHHSFVPSPDGSELFVVYHVHRFPEKPGDPRALAIDRVTIVDGDGGRPPTMKVAGPTTRPQPVPSGAGAGAAR